MIKTPHRPDATPDFDLVLSVTPEPTIDERDALVAALAVLLSELDQALPGAPTPAAPSRWARAGREAALQARLLQRDWHVRQHAR